TPGDGCQELVTRTLLNVKSGQRLGEDGQTSVSKGASNQCASAGSRQPDHGNNARIRGPLGQALKQAAQRRFLVLYPQNQPGKRISSRKWDGQIGFDGY